MNFIKALYIVMAVPFIVLGGLVGFIYINFMVGFYGIDEGSEELFK